MGLSRVIIPNRRVLLGGSALVGSVVAYQLAIMLLPQDSSAATLISDLGFCVLEVTALALCIWAASRTDEHRGRWIWTLVGLWLAFNLLADGIWSHYDLVLGVEAPSPGAADIGYLASYVAGFAAVLVATWKSSGHTRLLETTLDSTMFTIGAAGLSWPLLFGPLLETQGLGPESWVSLAYPVADLLIVFAFASFFLGFVGSGGPRPRPYYVVLCLAFALQISSDTAYLMLTAAGGAYNPGNWMDPVWLLAFATAGVAALMETRPSKGERALAPRIDRAAGAPAVGVAPADASSYWRILIPYVGLPVVAGMLTLQLWSSGWEWTPAAEVLVYLASILVGLILLRQYVTLAHNRRLNRDLHRTSGELEEKVGHLGDLNRRLESLGLHAHHLNSLRKLDEVTGAGLELACTSEQSPGGWITLAGDDGMETVAAVYGTVDRERLAELGAAEREQALGPIRTISLEVRDQYLGTMHLIDPPTSDGGPDMLPAAAAHVATAIDNVRGYEEALRLAERDPLTGLFNHRGIHKRLTGEALRAQQNGTELSVVMLDLDDFKVINDTYGHPSGDAVLRHTAHAITTALRHSDLAGRVGGDELLLVLPNTGVEGAIRVSARLKDYLTANPCALPSGRPLTVRLSHGIATYPTDAGSLSEVLEKADGSLYASKQRGGDVITLASDGRPVATAAQAPGKAAVPGKLLDLIGAHDHYTRQHSERVVLYALLLGRALDLPNDSLNTLQMAAMLHDVGKIGVSGDLLRKPTRLDPTEEDLIRRHADLGADIICDMPRLAAVAEAVRAHHEHYDGTGYPAGVVGDDIPLLGRILAVADAYSAMTLDKPYRKGMSLEQARASLEEAAGTQFDPALVHKLFDVIERQEPGTTALAAG